VAWFKFSAADRRPERDQRPRSLALTQEAAPCGWQLQVRHSISPHPLCQLHVDRLNPAPDVEPEVVERLDREHRRRVDKDVAPAVAVVDELRRPAYIVRVAQVDDDVAGAVRTTTAWSSASRARIAPPMAPAPPVRTATLRLRPLGHPSPRAQADGAPAPTERCCEPSGSCRIPGYASRAVWPLSGSARSSWLREVMSSFENTLRRW
jgi:hypothetical protein